VPDPFQTRRLDSWLATLVERKGSDLLLVADAPACIRVEGQVEQIESEPLTSAAIEEAVLPAVGSGSVQAYQNTQIADASYTGGGLGRFRINLHRERGMAAAAIRALPSKVPALSELNLPPGVEALARLPRGLVVVGGPAGSGKTTTVAALIGEINRNQARHVVTIEDPIEYHLDGIVQTQVDAKKYTFAEGLRSIVRQDPDVIMVGEIRDAETASMAIQSSLTGHMVFSTLHTNDAASAVARLLDLGIEPYLVASSVMAEKSLIAS